MIDVLGKKRFIILSLFLAINTLFAAQIYYSIEPQKEKVERDTRMARGRVSALLNNLDQMRVGFEVLVEQQEQFKALETGGFFDNQGRYEAGRIFEKVQADSGVISAKATIKSGRTLENQASLRAKHRILQSGISIKVEALDDTDVMYYFHILKERMPGHIAIENITMERTQALDGAALRAISSGETAILVVADIDLIWTTMIPENSLLEDQGGAR